MHERKACKVQLKQGDEGAVVALFSTYDVIDHDGDIVLPGAFEAGKEVPIGAWGHDMRSLPVGKGRIVDGSDGARLDGRLFLEASGGQDTYVTLKGLGEIAEWSYIYDVIESELDNRNGQDVRLLQKLDVWSVDPVLRGAGIGTQTEMVKTLDSKVAIPVHHTETAPGSWDGPGTEANIPNDASAAALKRMYAFRDPESDSDTKIAYKFIHHQWSDGPGAANLTGCSAGIAVLNGGRGAPIGSGPEADRQAVYRHLAAHLRDGEREPPALRSRDLSFADQAEHAIAGLLALKHRAEEIASGADKGSSLNKANRERLGVLIASIDGAKSGLDSVLKDEPINPDVDVLALYAEFQRLQEAVR